MLLDKHEEKEKLIRKLAKESHALHLENRKAEFVELPKKRFAGWYISLELSDARKRSDDADDLMEVMSIVGINKPIFFKSTYIVKYIRRRKYIYQDVLALNNTYHKGSNRWIPRIEDRTISKDTFDNLKPYLKKYFDKYKDLYGRPVHREVYMLGHGFPKYELVLKVKKAYDSHEKVVKSDVISKLNKINSKLKDFGYASGVKGAPSFQGFHNLYKQDTRDSYWDQLRNKKNRISAKAFTHELKKHGYTEENEEFAFKKSKTYRDSHV